MSQNNFHTRILFPANYLFVHIEIAQHSYGQKKILIYLHNHKKILFYLHEQHFFASFWSGKKLL